MLFVVTFFTFVVLYMYNMYFVKRSKYPPGPVPYPFIGNGIELAKAYNPADVCNDAAKKFGGQFVIFKKKIQENLIFRSLHRLHAGADSDHIGLGVDS